MCHLQQESRRGWPCSLPTCSTPIGEDLSLPCWVCNRTNSLSPLHVQTQSFSGVLQGGMRGEADWRPCGQVYQLGKVFQIQRKWDQKKQGDGCGRFPTAHPTGGCRGSLRAHAALLQSQHAAATFSGHPWWGQALVYPAGTHTCTGLTAPVAKTR